MIVLPGKQFNLSAAVLLLAVTASLLPVRADPDDLGSRSAALQSCPTVEEEIVDLELLKRGLRKSNAVGFVEKLLLKSAIDDLVKRLEAFHNGDRNYSLVELQEQYDVLLIRIAAHLQHKDRILHSRLCNAWEMIWQDLEDPERFAEKFS